MFNSFSVLLYQLGIIYLFWEFTGEISYTMLTQDLLQNSASYYPLCCLHYLILLESFTSSSTASLYNSLLYVPLCHIWNTSWFLSLSSSSILWLYCYGTLWTLIVFILFYFIFLILYRFCFSFLLDNEEVHDIVVTWYVTWCDIIGLEHGGRIWKMMSGHMYTT